MNVRSQNLWGRGRPCRNSMNNTVITLSIGHTEDFKFSLANKGHLIHYHTMNSISLGQGVSGIQIDRISGGGSCQTCTSSTVIAEISKNINMFRLCVLIWFSLKS